MKSILSLQEHAAGTFFPPALERKIRRGDGKDEQHQHTQREKKKKKIHQQLPKNAKTLSAECSPAYHCCARRDSKMDKKRRRLRQQGKSATKKCTFLERKYIELSLLCEASGRALI
jgi:hypothetical protein